MLTTQIHSRPDALEPREDRGLGVPQVVEDEPNSTPLPAVGSAARVGRYKVESVLGRGGMGIVYAAVDTKLARRVAIKLVRRQGGTGVRRAHERLRREAQALARLSHPNLVCVHDFGAVERGYYIVMELVEGERIDQHLRKREATWQEIVACFVQAGMGLAAAHAEGIVHRDFKPSNALVGGDGRVRVLDFGLACTFESTDAHKTVDSESSHPRLEWSRLTDVNVILGTAGYMAPEQVFGQPIGAAVDQFSFCVALFEALHGHRPYPAQNLLELGQAYRVGHVTPPRGDSEVPARVDELLRRGLSIDPAFRHPSMAALVGALAEQLVVAPVRNSRLRTTVLMLGTASMVVLGAGLAMGARGRPPEPAATRACETAAAPRIDAPPATLPDPPP